MGSRVVFRLKKMGRKRSGSGANLYTGSLANGVVRFVGAIEAEDQQGCEPGLVCGGGGVQYGIELDEVRGCLFCF